MQTSRKQLVEEFSGSVRALGKAVWHHHAQGLGRFQLHPGQGRLLFFVHRHKQVHAKDVAKAFGITPSAATQIADSLVKKGFLVRVPDPSDRRSVLLELSSKAHERFAKFRTEHLAMLTKVLRPLTDRELAQMIALHSKIAKGNR